MHPLHLFALKATVFIRLDLLNLISFFDYIRFYLRDLCYYYEKC